MSHTGEPVGCIHGHSVHTYARHQVGTRHAAASSRCRGARDGGSGLHVRYEKPVFNRAAFWKAIVYARYVWRKAQVGIIRGLDGFYTEFFREQRELRIPELNSGGTDGSFSWFFD